MPDKLTPEITPQLAISAFAVLHQYCGSISPHDCIRCAFYEHCPGCFMGCQEIRVRRSENYKATDKIRESVFTGSFLAQKFIKHVPQLFY